MTVYLALLRGINVGGKNIIKMAELKQVCEAIRLREVKTYIQSGNVLFKSDEEEEVLRKKLEGEIEAAFGITVPVVLRTAEELYQIIENCPFTEEQVAKAEELSKVESLYVSLLANNPSDEGIEKFNSHKSENDEFKIVGREVFLLFSNSIRNSKLANNLQKLDVSSTVRNWKTMNKLAALAKTMGS